MLTHKYIKTPKNLVAEAQRLVGLPLIYPIRIQKKDLGPMKKDQLHLGTYQNGKIVINSRFKRRLYGKTPESNLVHELIHAILDENGYTAILTHDQNETLAQDAEFWYLAGKEGVAPVAQKLLY